MAKRTCTTPILLRSGHGPSEAEVVQLLQEAAQPYEECMRLADLADISAGDGISYPRYAWDNPIGLVVGEPSNAELVSTPPAHPESNEDRPILLQRQFHRPSHPAFVHRPVIPSPCGGARAAGASPPGAPRRSPYADPSLWQTVLQIQSPVASLAGRASKRTTIPPFAADPPNAPHKLVTSPDIRTDVYDARL